MAESNYTPKKISKRVFPGEDLEDQDRGKESFQKEMAEKVALLWEDAARNPRLQSEINQLHAQAKQLTDVGCKLLKRFIEIDIELNGE